jgi:hypothetical protein
MARGRAMKKISRPAAIPPSHIIAARPRGSVNFMADAPSEKSKFQIPNPKRQQGLFLGFGIWDLGFGISQFMP